MQWAVVGPLLPKRIGSMGRPARDAREVFEGILWILRTGAPWKDLPERFPPYQTCHRRFQAWNQGGAMTRALHALAQDLEERGQIDLSECFIDGTFASAKRRALELVRQGAAKGPRSWQCRTATVFLSPSGLEALRRTR